MKKYITKYLFLLLCLSKVYSQNDSTKWSNSFLSDSVIIHSPPYSKWSNVYMKLKKDSVLMKKILENTDLKKTYDSTEKYFKLMKKTEHAIKLFSLAYPIISIILPSPKKETTWNVDAIKFVTLAPIFGVSVITPILKYQKLIFYKGKYISNCIHFIIQSGFPIEIDKWKATKQDYKRHKIFNEKFNRARKKFE